MSKRPTSSPAPSLRQAPVKVARQFACAFILALLVSAPIFTRPVRAQAPDTASIDRTPNALAYRALMDGRVEDAASMLRATLASNPADATAHQLLCRVFYAQDQAGDAIRQCEQAASAQNVPDIQASDNYLWLGRAYGMKARHAGPIAGFTLARRVQASFARAVELNPSNVAALSDLGEYDVAAPSIVGGGDNKAQALAARMMPRFPAAAHRLLARLADANNDLATAEAEFKRAVDVQGAPEAWIDLAQFYQTHSRPEDALAAIRSGLAADRTHGPFLVDAAAILTQANRESSLAEGCLRDYLASHAQSDAAPAFKVHLQLGRLLAARGDSANADLELQAAAALAPAFARNARTAHGV